MSRFRSEHYQNDLVTISHTSIASLSNQTLTNAVPFRVPNTPLTMYITRQTNVQVKVADLRAVYEQMQDTISIALMFGLPQLQKNGVFESELMENVNCRVEFINRMVLQPDGSEQGLSWMDLRDLVSGIGRFLVPSRPEPDFVDTITFSVKHDEYGAIGRGAVVRLHP